MKSKLVIHKYSYLKSPVYTWTIQNELGGSFTNSGPQKSLKKVLSHFRVMNPKFIKAGGESVAEIYTLDAEGQGKLVKKLNIEEEK